MFNRHITCNANRTGHVDWHEPNETFTFTITGGNPPMNPTVGALPTVDHLLTALAGQGITVDNDDLQTLDALEVAVLDEFGTGWVTTTPNGDLAVLTPRHQLAALATDTTVYPTDTRLRRAEAMVAYSAPGIYADLNLAERHGVADEFSHGLPDSTAFAMTLIDIQRWVFHQRSGTPSIRPVALDPIEPKSPHQQQPTRQRNRQLRIEAVGI